MPASLPPPDSSQRIERDAPPAPTTAPAPTPPAQDDGPGLGTRVADAASSTGVEEVAATVGKMLGVNKGTTRSLFRAWRKSRR